MISLSDFIELWLEEREVSLEDGLYKSDLLELIQDAMRFYKEQSK